MEYISRWKDIGDIAISGGDKYVPNSELMKGRSIEVIVIVITLDGKVSIFFNLFFIYNNFFKIRKLTLKNFKDIMKIYFDPSQLGCFDKFYTIICS